MSFNVALSGLRAANQDLNVTGNNIANASTVGFKQSRAEFADVYAGSILGNGSRTAGSGVMVRAIAQQFGQGNISITNNSLDMAISGEGFFMLRDQGSPVYTRAGIFGLDKDGYVVGANGARLQGYQPNANRTEIVSGAPSDLRVETSDIKPEATTEVKLSFNLDSDSPIKAWSPFMGSTAVTQLDFEQMRPGSPASTTGNSQALPAASGNLTITFDGRTRTIALDGTYGDVATLRNALQGQINAEFGSDFITVEEDAGVIALTAVSPTEGEIEVSGTAAASVFGSAPNQTPGEAPSADPTAEIRFTVQVGTGGPREVVLNGDYSSHAELARAIQNQLPGSGVTVAFDGGRLSMTAATGESITLAGQLDDLGIGSTPAERTSSAQLFDHEDPATYNWSTAATIYDSLGNPHVLTSYYVKTGQDGTGTAWSVYATLDGKLPNLTPDHSGLVGPISFGTGGGLNTLTPIELDGLWEAPPGAEPLDFSLSFGTSTQFGAAFSVNALSQDGYAPGRLAGIAVDDSGVVFARYTNGQGLKLGQVALANFANPQGLSPIGNTQWAESYDSGQPVIGAPQTASLGSIQSGALEDSNVDLSDQLVNLIIAQRNYQANAKTIETANAVTQSIINLR